MQYSTKHPSVKRLMKELKDMNKNPSPYYTATPLHDNLFDWHFTILGPEGTEFEGGKYHGRVILPPEYPFKPPHVMLLTPNGKFQLRTKICLSITGYHPETWQPAWSISTLLMGLVSLLPADIEGFGTIKTGKEARAKLAKESNNFVCSICGEKMSEVKFAEKDEERDKLKSEDKEFLELIKLDFKKDDQDESEPLEQSNDTLKECADTPNNEKIVENVLDESTPTVENNQQDKPMENLSTREQVNLSSGSVRSNQDGQVRNTMGLDVLIALLVLIICVWSYKLL